MRLGLLLERKEDFPFGPDDPRELDSELFAQFEEDALLSGLRAAGHDVVRIGDARRLLARIAYWRGHCELVFNLSVGYRGIERKLLAPAILEVAGIPYIGSTPYVLTLTRHKYHAKLLAQAGRITTPPGVLYVGTPPDWSTLQFPAIVKPVAESSSIGLTRQALVDSPAAALARAHLVWHTYRQPALIETFITGAEIEVPLLIDPEPHALGVAAAYRGDTPIIGTDFLTSEVVYADEYRFGPPPPFVDQERVVRGAEALARVFGVRDYARIDFRVDEQGTPWFIEASTHPHLQRISSFAVLAGMRGWSYDHLLDRIVWTARHRLGI